MYLMQVFLTVLLEVEKYIYFFIVFFLVNDIYIFFFVVETFGSPSSLHDLDGESQFTPTLPTNLDGMYYPLMFVYFG